MSPGHEDGGRGPTGQNEGLRERGFVARACMKALR
jgi:hypothetical protein